ncbi:MAG: alanine--tRNA ligase [Ignavibacteriota bacterium]|nr:alanine--tRNA ligase [Ignavibacteriota bacterium]MCO6446933.1 alanine--tRNA ligase [Ignavibacterium album]MCZ2268311.1 alanine--tRNA ligase [Ignavibacteriales bacterium]QKK00819.1 MAG: alanine--tRNA ligase [Ignavibacteriota bacterium]HOJ08713.1 alanine--tRNA ligase [Ignavibacteriaceae bacterium]
MTSQQIRQQFFDFFKNKEHRLVQSAPVVPFDDPTLLFTNAGMNQFKDVFLGLGTRDYKRAVDTQKCIRVSGKHNDLEEVGHDTFHHTFFEMLGNWSFGDYYKKEAIKWAWELLTEVWKLPKERLWATVYKNDDEAFEFWKSETDINPKNILRFGEKDNFWEMGETGPCGPCSEIHINVGDDYKNPDLVNAGSPECIEIWNLVFIQYNRDENGKLNELPAKHVDTGMGFERVCAVLQNKKSNYDTDVFTSIIEKVSKLSKIKYDKEEDKIPMRVIADHIRALTFAIADGAVPGNDGRGYVLRRILRRAARYGRKINLNEPFLYKLVDIITDTMGDVFPEVIEKKEYVKKVIKAEEESFNSTLDRGIELFDEVVKRLIKQNLKVIPGDEVFKLYDTYGFPADLTNVMAREINFAIDEEGFNKLMNEQKERGREASKDKFAAVNVNLNDLSGFDLVSSGPTVFTGYDELQSKAVVVGVKNNGDNTLVILDRSPFYVESGGQVDDLGKIIIGSQSYNVIDVTKINDQIIHVLSSADNQLLKPGAEVIAEVDENRRWDIMRNHSVTHFLHKALREVLGTHVQQAGSYVGPDRLRFDFTHFAKLTNEEIQKIESIVNEQTRKNYPLKHHRNTPFDEAKKMGALMFFGDKYGDKVNVVQFGDFTLEFCGGTHVHNSSEIGLFKILSESSIASGVRRIEAVTGAGVEKFIQSQQEQLKLSEQKIEELIDSKKKLEKEIAELKMKDKLEQLDHIFSLSSEEKSVKIFKGKVQADSMDELKSFGDEMRNKIKSGIGVLIAQIEDKVGIVCVVSDDLIKDKNLSAGKIVGELAKLVGGGGGGRPHLATAGGKDVSQIVPALSKVGKIVADFL